MEFIIGKKYENRKGRYTVLKITGSILSIRYDSGLPANLNVDTQRRIVEKMEKDGKLPTPVTSSKLPFYTWRILPIYAHQFFSTIGFLAVRGRLQAEVSSKVHKKFEKNYFLVTGKYVDDDDPNYNIFDNKWWAELRTYFNADSTELNNLYFGEDAEVKDTGGKGYVINNNSFFYELLKFGFDLGSQNINLIRSKIPQQFRNDFDAGAILGK